MAVKKKKKKYIRGSQITTDPSKFKRPEEFKEHKPEKQRFIVGGVDVGSQEAFDLAKRVADVEKAKAADKRITPEIERAVAGRPEAIRKAEAREALAEAGAFEEVTPKEIELSPDLKTDIPILTPTLGAAAQISAERGLLGIARDKGWLGDLLPKVVTGEEAFPIPETPETLREAALRQIRIDAFNKDTTRAEKFGAMMELLPGFGAIDQWVQGVIESPYENAEDVLDEINKVKEAASTGQEKVRNGLEDPGYGLDRARSMEEDIAKLSGRIKLLINQSKILQANTDKVNLIQEQILEAEEKVARYKQASSFGLTAQLTGTGRIIPTDEQIYFELKGGKKNG